VEIAKSREIPKKVWKGFSTREVGSNSERKRLLKTSDAVTLAIAEVLPGSLVVAIGKLL